VIGLLGGAFDPPHNGHVALAHAAVEQFDLAELVVVVAGNPGHKDVVLDAPTRLELARAAFPEHEVVLDDHPRTIDLLRSGRWEEPLFLIGADQFCDFPSWKEPDAVLDLARLGVATRPGYPRGRIESVLAQLRRPDRVEFFEVEQVPVASRDLRARAARGESLAALVPPAVADLIERRRLYGPSRPRGTLGPSPREEPEQN
jgi:nicotinate-nucleotide adenylyltransferase